MFSYEAFVYISKEQRTKLDFKSKTCIFLDYREDQFGYRLWDPIAKKVVHSCDVVFNEHDFPDLQKKKSSSHEIIVVDLFENNQP